MIYREIDSSIIKFLAWLASKEFGGEDGTFNSANFANVLSELFGLPTTDGIIVRMILSGREGIRGLKGGAHWQLIG